MAAARSADELCMWAMATGGTTISASMVSTLCPSSKEYYAITFDASVAKEGLTVGAFGRSNAVLPVLKEHAVAGVGIGVVVVTRVSHEVDVLLLKQRSHHLGTAALRGIHLGLERKNFRRQLPFALAWF